MIKKGIDSIDTE